MTPDADLCFEYSTLNAVINSPVTSIKNPAEGIIIVERVGKIIFDKHCKNRGKRDKSDELAVIRGRQREICNNKILNIKSFCFGKRKKFYLCGVIKKLNYGNTSHISAF